MLKEGKETTHFRRIRHSYRRFQIRVLSIQDIETFDTARFLLDCIDAYVKDQEKLGGIEDTPVYKLSTEGDQVRLEVAFNNGTCKRGYWFQCIDKETAQKGKQQVEQYILQALNKDNNSTNNVKY